MICDLCNLREAVIHIQQIIGNKKNKLHLCDKCAHEKGITNFDDKMEVDLANLFAGLFEPKKSSEKLEVKVCQDCGLSFEDFNKQNRLGCNYCYTVFSKILRYKMKRLTPKRLYTGKIPKKLQSYKVLFIDMEKLKNRLAEAVRDEDYELAASLRDKINKIRHTGYKHESNE